jgi:pimeloyl-ACP methyl ester carboxylesterase
MRVSRRGVLAGLGLATAGVAGAGTLVEYDVLPGRPLAHRLLGLDGEAGHVPDAEPGPRATGTLPSDHVDTDPGYVLLYPPGAKPGDPLPTVVLPHGAHSSAARKIDSMGLDRFLAASGRRLALAAVDGGDHSYWHARADGQDAGAMVLEDFFPFLHSLGLDPQALWGWSMGGSGALALSATEAGRQLGGVMAVSPALFPSFDDASPDAFDDRGQYDDVMALIRSPRPWTRVDCGTGDPFYRNDLEVLDGLDVETHYSPGAHDTAYWTRVAGSELAWLADRVDAD